MQGGVTPLPTAPLRQLAREVGFDLVGFARAEPIEPRFLVEWLEAGCDADMDWMGSRMDERLDVSRLLPGARTVIAWDKVAPLVQSLPAELGIRVVDEAGWQAIVAAAR